MGTFVLTIANDKMCAKVPFATFSSAIEIAKSHWHHCNKPFLCTPAGADFYMHHFD